MLTYSETTLGDALTVTQDGKVIGHIRAKIEIRVHGTSFFWRYHPKGSKRTGNKFPTIEEVKQSLGSKDYSADYDAYY